MSKTDFAKSLKVFIKSRNLNISRAFIKFDGVRFTVQKLSVGGRPEPPPLFINPFMVFDCHLESGHPARTQVQVKWKMP